MNPYFGGPLNKDEAEQALAREREQREQESRQTRLVLVGDIYAGRALRGER